MRTAIVGGILVLFSVIEPATAEHPWPMWGKNASRHGRTDTVGPQTPTIDWSVQIDFFPESVILEASPTLSEDGIVYVLQIEGLTAVDTSTREIAWTFDALYGYDGGTALWGDYVLFGSIDSAKIGGDTFYCVNMHTGKEVWREETHRLADARSRWNAVRGMPRQIPLRVQGQTRRPPHSAEPLGTVPAGVHR